MKGEFQLIMAVVETGRASSKWKLQERQVQREVPYFMVEGLEYMNTASFLAPLYNLKKRY